MADEEPQAPSKKETNLHLWLGLAMLAMALLAIVLMVLAAVVLGDRLGAGSGMGMITNPKGGQTGGGGSAGNQSTIGCNNVPSYKQCDSAWGSTSYNCGSTTICSSGCGVTAAAMVLSFYGKNVDPAMMAQDSLSAGYRECNKGTSHGFFPYIAGKYGLQDENGISWSRAMELLKQGKPIIISGKGPIPFTSGGHYIVLTCYNSDGTISVNDSAHPDASYPESQLKAYEHFITAIYP